jgi:lipoic acid synthetase
MKEDKAGKSPLTQIGKKNRLNLLPSNPEQADPNKAVGPGRFPSWLHRPLPKGNEMGITGQIMQSNRLHTVCEEARCPNLLECWSRKTATFLAMGKECSRACGFCDIDFSKAPKPLDQDEPDRIVSSVRELGLKHVVITMVARDDLEDGGAAHLAQIIRKLRKEIPEVAIEVLTSDFNGNFAALDIVLEAKPDIFNHNIETTRTLTPQVRHKATYERTLSVLSHAHQHHTGPRIKSGMMVGLGETEEQVQETIRDLHHAGCSILTIGQYLQPNRQKLLVKAFVPPEQFKKYEEYGYSIGMQQMYCGPFVRSSYHAQEVARI